MHGAPSLTLNDALSQSTHDHFKSVTQLEHSDSYGLDAQSGGPSGENLYFGMPFDPIEGVKKWFDERENCPGYPDLLGCQESVEPENEEKAVGHFTALVWNSARTIGCAVSDSQDILACRFGNNYVCNDEQTDIPCNEENPDPSNCQCDLSQYTPNMDGSFDDNVHQQVQDDNGVLKDEATCRAEIMDGRSALGPTDPSMQDPNDAPIDADASIYMDGNMGTNPYMDGNMGTNPYMDGNMGTNPY